MKLTFRFFQKMTETLGLNVEPTIPLDSGQKLGAFEGLFPHFTTDDSIVGGHA